MGVSYAALPRVTTQGVICSRQGALWGDEPLTAADMVEPLIHSNVVVTYQQGALFKRTFLFLEEPQLR